MQVYMGGPSQAADAHLGVGEVEGRVEGAVVEELQQGVGGVLRVWARGRLCVCVCTKCGGMWGSGAAAGLQIPCSRRLLTAMSSSVGGAKLSSARCMMTSGTSSISCRTSAQPFSSGSHAGLSAGRWPAG